MLNNNRPLITIEMQNGKTITAELYPESAPNTVNNMIYLINQGFYNGLTFYKVVKDLYIQTGDPTESGLGGPGYCIEGEFNLDGNKNILTHCEGTLSMARAIHYPDSAGSQFFIVLKDSLYLDGKYTAFGKVVSGLDVAKEIASVKTDYLDYPMNNKQVIKKITVDTYGRMYSPPVTVGIS